MGRGVSEAQWLAARAVSEGAVPTRVRVAAVLGVDPSHVYARSSKEGWAVIDGRNVEIRALYREAQAIAAALSGRDVPDELDDDSALTLAELDADADGAQAPWPDAAVTPNGAGRSGGPDAESEAGAVAGAADDAAADGRAAASPGLAVSAAPSLASAAPSLALTAAPSLAVPASQGLALPEWDTLEPVELLANAGAFVARQIGRLIQAADRRGGRLDRSQVEGLAALAKMLDRWEALARERAAENRTKSDEDLADVLARIDRRIVELAVEGAQFLDDQRRRKRAAPRRRGMGDAGALGAGAALASPAG